MTKKLLAFLMTISFLGFMACDLNDSDDSDDENRSIVGDWLAEDVSVVKDDMYLDAYIEFKINNDLTISKSVSYDSGKNGTGITGVYSYEVIPNSTSILSCTWLYGVTEEYSETFYCFLDDDVLTMNDGTTLIEYTLR